MQASSSSSKSGKPPGKLGKDKIGVLQDSQNSFLGFPPVTDLHLEVCIVPQKLGHPAAKGKDDKEKEKHPLNDVNDHLAEGDLEGTQVGVDR